MIQNRMEIKCVRSAKQSKSYGAVVSGGRFVEAELAAGGPLPEGEVDGDALSGQRFVHGFWIFGLDWIGLTKIAVAVNWVEKFS